MNIYIKRYQPDNFEVWNRFIEESKNGVFLFNRNFMDYHSERFIDHSLLVYKEDKIVAVFPANENGDKIISHEGLTFGSLVLSFNVKTHEVIKIFKGIRCYYSRHSFKEIIYKVVPHIFHKYPSEEDLYALSCIGATLIRRDISSVIDLSRPIRFSETKRQLIKKCMDQGLVVKEEKKFDNFWQLLKEVLKKFGTTPVHNIDEINSLKKNFPQNIRLFETRKNNTLLAGIVLFDYGTVVHTQYMAASIEGRKLGSLDFLNQFLLQQYKARKYYSFGISTESQGKVLNEGLIQQKENMGGRGITLDFYSIKLSEEY